MQETRINKFLSESGVCSRREADRAVEEGRVKINGTVALMGQKVSEDDTVEFDGKLVKNQERPVLLAVNKPVGIVCTTSRKEGTNIVDFLNYPVRVYPIGRLDKESEGLLLLTNQGELVNKILRGSYTHEKEYMVRVDKPLTDEFLKRMREGVPILDTVTKPCTVEQTGRQSFRIILTQGLNRQIRRMCQALGYRVRFLKRVRIMNIRLGDLKTGAYREVAGEERRILLESLKGVSGLPFREEESELPDGSERAF